MRVVVVFCQYLLPHGPHKCATRVGYFSSGWSKWRTAGHTQPETTCNEAREIIFILLLDNIFFTSKDLKECTFYLV
jgi:hypothetical protein